MMVKQPKIKGENADYFSVVSKLATLLPNEQQRHLVSGLLVESSRFLVQLEVRAVSKDPLGLSQ